MHEVCPFVLTSAGVENSKGITWAKGVPFSFHMFPYTWVRISFKAIMSYYLSLTIQKLLTVQYLTNRGSHLKIGIKPNRQKIGAESFIPPRNWWVPIWVHNFHNLDRCEVRIRWNRSVEIAPGQEIRSTKYWVERGKPGLLESFLFPAVVDVVTLTHLFQYVCTELLDEQCTLQVLVTGIV